MHPLTRRISLIVVACVSALAVCAVLLRGRVNPHAELELQAPPLQQTSHENEALASQADVEAGNQEREAAPAGEGPDAPGAVPDCEFFNPWRAQPGSPEVVVRFLDAVDPLAGIDLRCVPADWLLLAMILHCQGAVPLSSQELDLIAAQVWPRMPDPEMLCRGSFADSIELESLECLITSLLPPDASEEEVGQVWAWWLATAFGGKGDFMVADPESVAALQAIMAEWLINDDAWWSHLWAGFLGGQSASLSDTVFLAISEALHEMLSEDDWIYRLSTFAEFSASQTFTLGVCLSRHLDSEKYMSLLTSPGGDRWRRALIWGLDFELRDSGGKHRQVPDDVARALIEMRDSGEFAHHLDIVQFQWRLLGAVEAVIDFENFVYTVESSSSDWEFEGAIRIYAAIEAMSAPNPSEQDAVLLDHAQSLLRELLVSTSPSISQGILVALRDRWVLSAEGRRMLADIMGSDGLGILGPGLRSWLRAP